MKSIVLPKSIETIGEKAFWGCTTLTYINFPQSLKSKIDIEVRGEVFIPREAFLKLNEEANREVPQKIPDEIVIHSYKNP